MTAAAPPEPAIRIRDLSVTLGGNRILKDISLEFGTGTISGLIGPNGAGKSTLLNYICRIIPAVSGRLTILGRDADRLLPHQVLRSGLARTYQGAQFVGELSALDNVMLGCDWRLPRDFLSAALRLPRARRTERRAREIALAALEQVGIPDLAGARIGDLSFGNQRRVDLARALAADAPCILLDEPMAGLSRSEKASICEVLLRLQAEGGRTIILVEHDLQVVSQLCRQIVVLDAGELIAAGPTAGTLALEAVRRAYMGEAA